MSFEAMIPNLVQKSQRDWEHKMAIYNPTRADRDAARAQDARRREREREVLVVEHGAVAPRGVQLAGKVDRKADEKFQRFLVNFRPPLCSNSCPKVGRKT